MKKSRKLSLIPKLARAAEIEKRAYMSVGDVEDHVGMLFSDKEEARVRKHLKKQKSKSFILRHPWLTGIPTLGIAPAIAHAHAMDKVTRRLARDNTKFRKQYAKTQKENYQLKTDRIKADAPRRAVSAAVPAILAGFESRRKKN